MDENLVLKAFGEAINQWLSFHVLHVYSLSLRAPIKVQCIELWIPSSFSVHNAQIQPCAILSLAPILYLVHPHLKHHPFFRYLECYSLLIWSTSIAIESLVAVTKHKIMGLCWEYLLLNLLFWYLVKSLICIKCTGSFDLVSKSHW